MNLRGRRSIEWIGLAMLSLIVSVVGAHPTLGGFVKVQKDLTWTFTKQPGPNAMGSGHRSLDADGWCLLGGHDHDGPNTGPFSWNLANGYNNTWAVKTPIPPHGHGEASVDVTVNALGAGIITAKTVVQAKADAAPAADSPSGGTALGAMRMSISNGSVAYAGTVWKGGVVAPITGNGSWIRSGSFATGGPKDPLAYDPITLTLVDADTGSELTQELFRLELSGRGDVSWQWNASGLSLRLAKSENSDEFVSLVSASPSDWISSTPLNFSAAITTGSFSATGLFKDLPWQLDYEGSSVVGAFLPASSLPVMSLEYTIPQSVLQLGHAYEEVLGLSHGVYVAEAAVPNPSSFALILIGLSTCVGLLARGDLRSTAPMVAHGNR